jgi:glycosyltransferase involved in cell wall biosynthesis
MVGKDHTGDAPAVTVIIPARNEEACLKECIESLIAQAGVDFEIIVVDDQSTDRTREIAESFSVRGVRVAEAPELAAGWTGKNNAAAAGAKLARGEWILFTDADTVHLPGSLARAVTDAERYGASMLSYSPRQIVETFAEKAVMPVIFAELAAAYRPSLVSDPGSSVAAANGQYILIRREAYDAVGGHAAIRDQILEDVALARAVKRTKRKIIFRYGAESVQTHMYRNFAQLREGWTKNLALLFSSARRLALLRALEFILIVACAGILIFGLLHGFWRSSFVAAGIGAILYAKFLARIRKAHFNADANALALIGLPIFCYLLLRSKRFHERNAVPWKGRIYPDSRPSSTAGTGESKVIEERKLLPTNR